MRSPLRRSLSPPVSFDCRRFVLALVSLYLFLHLIALLYNHVVVIDEKRILEKRELYDGPLVMSEHSKRVIYNKQKGVYTGVALLNSADLFEERLKEKKALKNRANEPSLQFWKELSSTASVILSSLGERDKFFFFSLVPDSAVDVALNWACNVEAFPGLLNRTLLISAGEETCRRLRKRHPEIKCIPSFTVSMKKGTSRDLQRLRAKIHLRLVQSTLPFVSVDVSSTWLRSPLGLFSNVSLVDDADVVAPVRGDTTKGMKYTMSPLVVYPTNGTEGLFAEMLRRLEGEGKETDREILTQLCHSQFNGVVCRNFDWEDVADVKWKKMTKEERSRLRPFIVNDEEKKPSSSDVSWLLSGKASKCSAGRRKRLLLVHGDAWEEYRKGSQ